MLWTKAVATEQIPNPSVTAGRNQPGPIHLHASYMVNALSVDFVQKPNPGMTDWSMPYIAGNFENDICNEENRQDGIVIITLQSEIFGETGQLGITCRIKKNSLAYGSAQPCILSVSKTYRYSPGQ